MNAQTARCCICMEDIKSNATNSLTMYNTNMPFKCYTCKDGIICGDCIVNWDESGVNYHHNTKGGVFRNRKEQKRIQQILTCPCCRTMNWHYYKKGFIGALDFDMQQYEPATCEEDLGDEPKVMLIYYRNSKE